MNLETFISELNKIGNSELSFLKFNEVDEKYEMSKNAFIK